MWVWVYRCTGDSDNVCSYEDHSAGMRAMVRVMLPFNGIVWIYVSVYDTLDNE